MTAHNALVVGGAGYLGSRIVESFLESGASVAVVDALLFGRDGLDGLPDSVAIHNCDLDELNINDYSGFDVVIFSAGVSNDPTANWRPDVNWEENFHKPVEAARRAKRGGIPHFVFASTCSVYHSSEIDFYAHEKLPLDPRSHYAKSKLAAEEELQRLVDDRFSVTCLRMGTLHGSSKRMRFDLVVNQMFRDAATIGTLKAPNDRRIVRPLLHVTDAADAYRTVACQPGTASFSVYNLVAENMIIRDMAVIMRDELLDLGITAEIENFDVDANQRSYLACGEKAREVLGFSPRVTVRDSVRELARHWGSVPKDVLMDSKFTNIDHLVETNTYAQSSNSN